MARNKATVINIDNSDPANYPDGRIKDDQGSGNGTPVNEYVYGDIHENLAKLLRLYGIGYNGLSDNEQNGYQIVEGMIALASKNDFLLSVSYANNSVNVPLKLNFVKPNETFLVRVGFDYDANTHTTLRGLDNSQAPFTVQGNFKANDLCLVVKSQSGWVFTRLVDATNISAIGLENNFLKAATQEQENEGTLNNVATTPLTNLLAFMLRVNGDNSDNYLASSLRNGIYPKEHYDIVQNIAAPLIRNTGFFSGLDIGGSPVGTTFTVGGNITNAVVTVNGGDYSAIECTMENAMDNTNYFVNIMIESLSDSGFNANILTPVFRILSTNKFRIMVKESASVAQNIRIHLQVTQIV